MTTPHIVIIPEALLGQRLDKALPVLLPHLSRARIQALIQAGFVRRDTQPIIDQKTKVLPNQIFTIEEPSLAEVVPQAQEIPLDVLYEDEDLLIINKPPGMVVHPGAGQPDSTLVNALLAHCQESLSGIGGVKRPGIVHRLDKQTSGLLVVAKNDFAHHHLSQQFQDRTLALQYYALVWGLSSPMAGNIVGNIGRHPRQRHKMALLPRGGKPAQTDYEVVTSFGTTAALIKCQLHSGRTHQIRVHMTSRGHGIIGDQTYGQPPKALRPFMKEIDAFIKDAEFHALHAFSLRLIHPRTEEKIALEAPLPPLFQELVDYFTTRFQGCKF